MSNEEIKYSLSEAFKNFLVNVSEGIITGEQYDLVIEKLNENAIKYFFDNSSESNLIRILSSIFDKKTFLIDSLKYHHHLEIICAISSLSNYLTDIIVRNPEYLYKIFDQDYLSSSIEDEILFTEIDNSVDNFKTLASKTKMLRNLKRKYLLKIGVCDILAFKDLKQTTADLSKLANLLSSKLFEICYEEIGKKYAIELPKDYALCSLGKLGGNELNYSSDIDLILLYKENFEIEKVNRDYHELISEALQVFIREATSITSSSYLYRVDFRLRPDGRNSLLCRTISDYLRYYETRGEDWERQMLIKLGFVAGDKNLFLHFKNYIDGFIYPKSFHNSITETITKMKRSIEAGLIDETNIKLIPGGIRDIEFSVQALQLMNGGRFPKLKTGNTLEALNELLRTDLITLTEYKVLKDAYILYRKLEHFVQLMNDKQTHSLPQDVELANKLSKFLGYKTTDELNNSINNFRKAVKEIYSSIVEIKSGESKSNYADINFRDIHKAKSNVKFLSSGLSLLGEKQFDITTIKLFHEIEPELVGYLQSSNSPDLVLENFIKVIRNSSIPSVWYSSFKDTSFFKTFLSICEFGQRSIDYMFGSKNLRDLFLSKKVFQEIDVRNIESLETVLFILSVQFTIGLIDSKCFSDTLSSFITKKVILHIEEKKISYPFFVAGLGSFATSEMSFGSDVDLIVVVEDLNTSPSAQNDFQELLVELRKTLNPIEVDFRLRPEGNNSPLVWDLEGYSKYINSRMRIWEFQALSKAKFLYGSENIFDSLINSVSKKLNDYSNDFIIEEVNKMYKSKLSFSHTNQTKLDVKNSHGALITIDTILGSLQLRNSKYYREFVNCSHSDKLRLLNDFFTLEESERIKQNFLFLKKCQITMQNLFVMNKSVIPNDKNKIQQLAHVLGFDDSKSFIESLQKIFKENIDLLNKTRNFL